VEPSQKPRVCAGSYLNTVPLIWGLEHSPALRDTFDMRYELPSLCADLVARGESDIGILPVMEMAREKLEYFRGTGIACRGPVRSILLISKVPFAKVRTLAVDSGSRTSVMLARVILAERYGAEPRVFAHPADLAPMLEAADAALIIGDAALHLDPANLPFECLDLGAEWVSMTGLPMVFAVWSGRTELIRPEYERAFLESCRYGLSHIDDIARQQPAERGISEAMTREYLTRHIVFELGEKDYEGMRLYLQKALRLDQITVGGIHV
jgi:predicted solute-binding protein